MRKDARKTPISWRLKPEVVAMIREMWQALQPEGWSQAEIVEQAVTDMYWKWREKGSV